MQEVQVILVNEKDEQIGLMSKLEAHEKGLLHRAFSVFIFSSDGKLLLQKRALHKYHSAGLWSNTCCSHPLPNEDVKSAAERRLLEEMGLSVSLDFCYAFTYKASFDNHLIEHEYDHIFVGYSDAQPILNKDEVSEWTYVTPADLLLDIKNNNDAYTVWFSMSIKKVLAYMETVKAI